MNVTCPTCGRVVPLTPGAIYGNTVPVAHVDERRGPRVVPNAVTPCREMQDRFYMTQWHGTSWPELDL